MDHSQMDKTSQSLKRRSTQKYVITENALLNSVFNVEALVGTFHQEKALVGAFSVFTNLRMELFEALQLPLTFTRSPVSRVAVSSPAQHVGGLQQSWAVTAGYGAGWWPHCRVWRRHTFKHSTN